MQEFRQKLLTFGGKLKTKFQNNERLITFSALMWGLVVDTFTLNRIDQLFDNMILVTYIIIATISIFFINIANYKQFKTRVFIRLQPYMMYLMQFAFGGLLSGFVVFYTRSASIYVAWPFLILLYFLFFANDGFRPFYKKLEFQIAMLFGGIFGMAIFVVPTLNGIVNNTMFIISGITSLCIIAVILFLLYSLISNIALIVRRRIMIIIAGIFMVFQVLYFTHSIPPIPLSLKHSKVYYSIEKAVPGIYDVRYKPYPWYRIDHHVWRHEFYKSPGTEKMHAFLSVFGPNNLKTQLRHEWHWYDEEAKKWIYRFESDYEIRGGRGGGYRWYSYVNNPAPGTWRVRVMTKHNREVGRMYIDVIESQEQVELKEKEI